MVGWLASERFQVTETLKADDLGSIELGTLGSRLVIRRRGARLAAADCALANWS